MDDSEKLVQAHLRSRGFSDVEYEPDGNIPPDFLVNRSIAVEVRRLNQNDFSGPARKGLEEVSIPLWRSVQQIVASFGPPTQGESWFVNFRFSRPVETLKTLEPKLRSGLSAFALSPTKRRSIVAAGQNFELEVFCRTSKPYPTMFVMGGCSDQDSGGWLLAEMHKNICYCEREKQGKVSAYRHKYPFWWLALADHIGYGLDEFDREMFRENVSITHTWDKIIIIDPRDHTRWFEI